MAATTASCNVPDHQAGTWICDSHYDILDFGQRSQCGALTVSRHLLGKGVPCFNRTEEDEDQTHDLDWVRVP